MKSAYNSCQDTYYSFHKNYDQLITYAKACVKPAFDYFNSKFGTDLEKAVSAFKYARFFDPVKILLLKSSLLQVTLKDFVFSPFLILIP